ncbi:unnamed protein product [Sphacelaria rigidula]
MFFFLLLSLEQYLYCIVLHCMSQGNINECMCRVRGIQIFLELPFLLRFGLFFLMNLWGDERRIDVEGGTCMRQNLAQRALAISESVGGPCGSSVQVVSQAMCTSKQQSLDVFSGSGLSSIIYS